MTPADLARRRDAPGRVLLAIDTAGSACSAAIARDGRVLAAESRPMRHGHAEALLPMIDRVAGAAGLAARDIGVVAAATGPGGFTGIRVGLAAARGIALAVEARLAGVSSFAAVAARVAQRTPPPHDAVLLVALDSRRADLYVQLFAAGDPQPLAAPASLLPDALAGHVAGNVAAGNVAGRTGARELLIAGDAAEAAAAALGERFRCAVVASSAPDALGVAAAALRRLRAGGELDPAAPLYLRPPDVTLPPARPPPARSPTARPPPARPPTAASPG